mmetsp:Transcript_56501/g.158530  ORF Transcript_56501/g.158530 Transcript_56501/m.158530 type:complete len:215 (+) Transcript_56501:810-1454(+)
MLVLKLQHDLLVAPPSHDALHGRADPPEEVVVGEEVLVEELEPQALVRHLRHRDDDRVLEGRRQRPVVRGGLEPVAATLDDHVGVGGSPPEPRDVLGQEVARPLHRELQDALRRRTLDGEDVRIGAQLEAYAVREHHRIANPVCDDVEDLLADEVEVQQALSGALEVHVDERTVVEEGADALDERRRVHEAHELENHHTLDAEASDAEPGACIA